MQTIYKTATNTSNILSVNVTNGHGMQTATTTVEALNTTLDVGDEIVVDIGYVGDHDVAFTGYVKSIQTSESPIKYTITAMDTLSRAMDYFIVSSSPETPMTRQNIQAENLVHDIMEVAGLTNYSGDATSFTFGVNGPVEINLVSSYDYAKFLADLIAWHIYATSSGQVRFLDRKPYVMGGDTPYKTIIITDTTAMDYSEDIENLRNRVVLYGANNITAEASSSSPYLPNGFYKSAVISTLIVDTQTMADQSVAYNLALYNRLTKGVSMTVIGDQELESRKVLTLNTGNVTFDGDWYIYGVSHTINSAGFITELELRN